MKKNIPDTSGDDIFYVFPQSGRDKLGNAIFDKSKTVTAKFLFLSGLEIVDPVPNGSNNIGLYKKLNSDGTIDERSRFQNPNNYLIFPAGYDPSEASVFAKAINVDIVSRGITAGIADMAKGFWPGGDQDLQRGGKRGVPNGDTAPAFKDAASWHFGFVTEQTNIPNVFAEIVGGILNIAEFFRHPFVHKLPIGAFGLDPADAKNFRAGVHAAQPFVDHRLALIHENALAIGGNIHESIAPIAQPPTRPSEPSRPGIHADSDGPPENGYTDSLTHVFKLTEASKPNALPDIFYQIGHQILQSTSFGEAVAPLDAPDLVDSASHKDVASIGNLVPNEMHGIGNIENLTAPHTLIGNMFSSLFQHSQNMAHHALPSIAPRGHVRPESAAHRSWTSHHDAHNTSHGDKVKTRSSGSVKSAQTQTDVKRALEVILNQQARLPPSGPTAFNPSLTPAWAGLKIPM